MEIVIIFIFTFLGIWFFYLLISRLFKYCKKNNRTQDEFLLQLENELDLEIGDNNDLESDLIQNNNQDNIELTREHAVYQSKSHEECSICLDEFFDKKVIQFDCMHKYHLECLNDWISQRKNNIICPECGI